MGKIQLTDILAYISVSVLAVAMAAFLSLQFLKPASSQETESSQVQEPAAPSAVSESTQEPEQEAMPQLPEEDLSQVAPPEDMTPRPQFPSLSPKGTADSVREVEVFLEPFIYDARERRDPFEPFHEPVEKTQPQGPLQMYPLEDLRLIGIMWDIKKPRAMFVDPANQVHVAIRDDGIGKKNGYIAAIREGEVVVVEAERTEKGISYETKVIRLPR